MPDHMLEQARHEIAEIKTRTAREPDKLRDGMRTAEELIACGQSLVPKWGTLSTFSAIQGFFFVVPYRDPTGYLGQT